MKLLLLLFILATLLNSCGDKKCPCMDESIIPTFIGYDSSQVDTIKIKRFEKGSNFSRALDSFEITPLNGLINQLGNALGMLSKDAGQRVMAGYDWQITNPFDNKSVQISEIEISKQEQNCGGSLFGWDRQECFNPINSFKVNGSPYAIDRTFGSSGVVIRK